MDLKWIIAVALALLVGVLLFLSPKSPEQALGPQAPVIFAQGGANQIAVVDSNTGEIARIAVGPATHGVGVLPDGRTAYASSFGSDEISVVDLTQREEIAKVNVGGKSHHLAVSPDGRFVYVTVGSNDTVAVVDNQENAMAKAIPVAQGPTYTVFAPDGRKAYVTSMGAGVVSVIDTEQMSVSKEIPVGQQPDHLAITPDGRFIYVANQGSNDVSVIDAQSDEVVATIPVGRGPHGVAVVERQGEQLVSVGNRGETTLSLIDPRSNRVIQTIDLGVSPEHLVASPDRTLLYVGSIPAKSLLLFDVTRTRVVKKIDVGGEIHQIAVIAENAGLGQSPEYELVRVAGGRYYNIDADRLAAMLEQKDFTLVNVHIPYAGELPQTDLFIPFNEIEANLDELPQDVNAKIVVYCRSGSMSAIAAETLVKLGYTNVWNLKQGMKEWQQQGYPLLQKERSSEQSTAVADRVVTLYRDPTCGCCHEYARYLEERGFQVRDETVAYDELEAIKRELGVPSTMRSCHTAKVGRYFIEGHVPVEAIQKLLEEQPEIDGIALPGMPGGSPGMGGEKTESFVIYAVKDGEISEYVKL